MDEDVNDTIQFIPDYTRFKLNSQILRFKIVNHKDYRLFRYYLTSTLFFKDKVIEQEPIEVGRYRKRLIEEARRLMKEQGFVKTSSFELKAELTAGVEFNSPLTYFFDAFITSTKRASSKIIQIYSSELFGKDISDDFSLGKFVHQIKFDPKDGAYAKLFKDDTEFKKIFLDNWSEWLERIESLRTKFEHQEPLLYDEIVKEMSWSSIDSLEDEPKLPDFKLFNTSPTDVVTESLDGLRKFSGSLLKIIDDKYSKKSEGES